MKIAVLMHGAAGTTDKFGTGENLPLNLSYKHFKKHVLEPNSEHDIDIFMHCWSTEYKENLLELYNPVKEVFEPQIIFDYEYSIGDPNKKGNPNDETGLSNRADFGHYFGFYRGLDNLRFHSMFSKWYSALAVNGLKSEFEKENDFIYDYVFLTRYDLAYLTDIKFSSYDKNKFYVIGPDGGPNRGYNDLWYFSDSQKMDIFTQMFNFIKQIKHFPHKHVQNHFLSREHVHKSGLKEHVEFVFNRPWDNSTSPSPPTREWHNLQKASPVTDMQKVREHITKISERTISE